LSSKLSWKLSNEYSLEFPPWAGNLLFHTEAKEARFTAGSTKFTAEEEESSDSAGKNNAELHNSYIRAAGSVKRVQRPGPGHKA
jgi:hypothetical protein